MFNSGRRGTERFKLRNFCNYEWHDKWKVRRKQPKLLDPEPRKTAGTIRRLPNGRLGVEKDFSLLDCQDNVRYRINWAMGTFRVEMERSMNSVHGEEDWIYSHAVQNLGVTGSFKNKRRLLSG